MKVTANIVIVAVLAIALVRGGIIKLPDSGGARPSPNSVTPPDVPSSLAERVAACFSDPNIAYRYGTFYDAVANYLEQTGDHLDIYSYAKKAREIGGLPDNEKLRAIVNEETEWTKDFVKPADWTDERKTRHIKTYRTLAQACYQAGK